MPRRRRAEIRDVAADPIYNSTLAEKFINSMMWAGQKAVARRVFYGAMTKLGDRANDEPLKIFRKAVENCKPILEVKSRRVGGANYQVPVEVRPARRTALAIRWLIGFARDRKEHSMAEKLAAELIAASKREGSAIKKREDTHRMAEANKAFAHYRF